MPNAAEIINNIGEELGKLYVPAERTVFSEEPEVRQTEQVLLYYMIKRSHEFARATDDAAKAALYKGFMDKIRSGEHPLCKYVLSCKGELRQAVLEDLASVTNTDTMVGRLIQRDVLFVQEKDHYDASAEAYVLGLFAPVPDASGMQMGNFSGDDTQKTYERQIREAQDAVEALPLQVPAGQTDRSVTLMTLGCFFADDLMTQSLHKSMSVEGSTLAFCGTDADNGRGLVISNLFDADKRVNMHLSRTFAPEARRRAAAVIEAYKSGNKRPFAEALLKTFKVGLRMSRYSMTPDAGNVRATMKYAAEAYDMLNSPELKGLVSFSETEMTWLESCRCTLQLQDDFCTASKDLAQLCMQRLYQDGKPMDDPDVRRVVERLLKLKLRKQLYKNIVSDYLITNNGQAPLVEQEAERASRPLGILEIMALREPEALDQYLHERIQGSAWLQSFESLPDWKSFAEHTASVRLSEFDSDPPTTYPDRHEMLCVPGKLRKLIALIPEGNDDFIQALNGLSCMKPGAVFPKEPTVAQLTARKQEYERFIVTLQEDFDPIMVTEKMGRNEMVFDVVQQVITDLRLAAHGMDKLIKSEPDRRRLAYIRRSQQAVSDGLKRMSLIGTHPADTIVYTDADGRPVDKADVRDRLLKGDKLRFRRFMNGSTVGISNSLTLDPATARLKEGPDRVAVRTVDYAAPTGTLNDTLTNLRRVRETLKKTDSFYVPNHTQFKELMQTLDEVIRTQEAMPAQPNIRQIDTLTRLYAKLDKKKDAYVAYKAPILKADDERGAIRLQTIRSLGSLTNAGYVREAAGRTYAEMAKLQEQTRASEQLFETVKRLSDTLTEKEVIGNPTDIADFCKGFDHVMDFITERKAQGKPTDYIALRLSNVFPKLLSERAEDDFISKINKDVHPWEGARADAASAFAKECENAAVRYAGMTPDVVPAARSAAPRAAAPEAGGPHR